MGFYFFGCKKVNKKILAKNKLYGVSINVGALITHFGGVLIILPESCTRGLVKNKN